MLDSPGLRLLLIDVRTPEEFAESHIHGAINIPEKMVYDELGKVDIGWGTKVVFYCNGLKCGKSSRAARKAAGLGYRNVMVLIEGMPVWEEKGYPFFRGPDFSRRIKTRRITPQEVNAIIGASPEGVTLVDVCDREEYAEEHIPGAINIPLASFAAGSGILDKNKHVIVYCKSGGRSSSAYRKLRALDFDNIYQLIIDDWKAAGMPVIQGSEEDAALSETEDAAAGSDESNKVLMSIDINAPVSEVFSFVASPYNWQKYIPGLRHIGYAPDKPIADGSVFNWTYNIRGIDISGTGRIEEYVHNRKFSLRMHTLMPIRKTVWFDGNDQRTTLKVSVGYDSTSKVLSFMFRAITRKINHKESSVILNRIKTACEGAVSDKQAMAGS